MRTELAPRERSLRLGERGLRPRERLLRCGASALSDEELLAVLLRTESSGASAVELAHDVLREIGGLVGLRSLQDHLPGLAGIAQETAMTLRAAVELARRLARAEIDDCEILDNPVSVARYLSLRYSNLDQQTLGALFLNVRQQVISEREVFRGTLCRTLVEPRAILKQALLTSAASVILFHSHPTGEPSPSPEDLAFSRRMVKAARLLDIRVADHLILGGRGKWVSLARRGALAQTPSEDEE